MKKLKLEKWLALFFILLGIFLFTRDYSLPSPRALPGEPPKLYSTQAGDHIQDTLLSALQGAKNSIVLMIYTLKDAKIIQAFNDKARQGVDVKIIYDAYASQDVAKKLAPEIKLFPRGADSLCT